MASSSFAYTSVPNTLRQFLKGVPGRGVPAKINPEHLKSIGLKALNDQSIIRVLKFVGLLNGDGSPSEGYKDFRDKTRGPALLAKEIQRAYRELFETYPDAYAQADESLRNFFTGKTNLGQKAISFIVSTFKVLCEFGDFSGVRTTTGGVASTTQQHLTGASTSSGASGSGPSIHINLQVHLPDAADPTTYDAIFAAINRHLGKLL